ncbi:MAG: Flp family type IVb pilin [Terracidiphilus sp.]
MIDRMLKVFAAAHNLLEREEGQDIVEYSLTFVMVAFGCVSSMTFLATGIGDVFDQVVLVLSTNLT